MKNGSLSHVTNGSGSKVYTRASNVALQPFKRSPEVGSGCGLPSV